MQGRVLAGVVEVPPRMSRGEQGSEVMEPYESGVEAFGGFGNLFKNLEAIILEWVEPGRMVCSGCLG